MYNFCGMHNQIDPQQGTEDGQDDHSNVHSASFSEPNLNSRVITRQPSIRESSLIMNSSLSMNSSLIMNPEAQSMGRPHPMRRFSSASIVQGPTYPATNNSYGPRYLMPQNQMQYANVPYPSGQHVYQMRPIQNNNSINMIPNPQFRPIVVQSPRAQNIHYMYPTAVPMGQRPMPMGQRPMPVGQRPGPVFIPPPTNRSSTPTPHLIMNQANAIYKTAHQRPMYRPSVLVRSRKNSASIIPIRFSSFERIDASFLSKVARYFKEHIVLNTEVLESIEYRDCFTGKHAVDILSELVYRRDRSVALMLGRSLDSQFFFHDVNWQFRLVDSKEHLYEFNASTLFKNEEQRILPTAVTTSLTKCFSPTCAGPGCYSISCPFKPEQATWLKKQVLVTSEESAQLIADQIQSEESNASYWSSFAPIEIVSRLSKNVITKQEVIYELIQSEKNYVYGLEVIFETFRDSLRRKNVIEIGRREEFLSCLLINRQQILAAHRKLLQKLLQKQKESFVVLDIAQVFLNQIEDFGNYIEYAKNEPYARWIFTKERESNREFSEFLEEFQRNPKNKRAEFDHYLRIPSTRFAGYRLQLDRILKYTEATDEEASLLVKLTEELTEIGKKCNIEGGKTVDNIKLLQFRESTDLTNNEAKLLNLTKPLRQIVRSGNVVIKKLNDLPVDYTLFDHVLLFLSIRKSEKRKVYKRVYPLELVKLDELTCLLQEVSISNKTGSSSGASLSSTLSTSTTVPSITFSSSIVPATNTTPTTVPSSTVPTTTTPPSTSSTSTSILSDSTVPSLIVTSTVDSTVDSTDDSSVSSVAEVTKPSTKPVQPSKEKQRFTVQLHIHGPEKTSFTLVFKTDAEKVSWQRAVLKQKLLIETQHSIFKVKPVGSVVFNYRITSTATLNGLLFYAHDKGISVASIDTNDCTAKQVLELNKVTQIHTVPSVKTLLVLADKTLYSFEVHVLLSEELSNSSKINQTEKISTGVAFFQIGNIYGKRHILCSVKNGSLDSKIKLFEPRQVKIEKKRGFVSKTQSYSSWNYFEELYVPSVANSLQFLNNRLCIACTKGYEIVDLDNLQSQSLLDLSDERLKTITSRDNCRSMSLFKVADGKFLLCYNAFGFFVDQYGRCNSLDYMTWQGEPVKFVYEAPYLTCFNHSFLEIHNVITCELVQIIPGDDISLTNDDLKQFVSFNSQYQLYQLIK